MTQDAPIVSGPETVTGTELITPAAAEALAGLLGLDPSSLGSEVPPLWHWTYLLDRRPQRDLGPDGHPTSGIPAPPEPGRLRMFAGGRVTAYGTLRFGESATRTTRLVRTVDKQGRSGPMTLSTVRSDIQQRGRTVIVDEQDIVYRMGGSSLPPPTAPAADGVEQPPPDGLLELDVDPVVLFRFSALTYNAHRIHYDVPYTRSEGYPDLVVHGPLQALLMGECLRRSGAAMVGAEFAYRLVAPTYGAQRLQVTSRPGEDGTVAEVRDGTGRLTATAVLRRLPDVDVEGTAS